METRPVHTVAEFAKAMLSEIAAISPDRSRDVFVHVESGASTERLETLLQSLSTISLKPSFDSLEIFLNYLKQRWDKIRKTDAVYFISPHSRINRICLRLARKLSDYDSRHPFELLMPTISGFINYFPHKTWDSIQLNEFILRDDDTPLSVLDAFALIEHENKLDNLDRYEHIDVRKKLSYDEKNLLAAHSAPACAYYKILHNRSTQQQEKETAKQAFISFMNTDIATLTPGSTYEMTGKRKLAKEILDHMGDRRNLVALFARIVPQAEWRTFMAVIRDADYFRVMLGVDIKKTTLIETDSELEARRLKQVESALRLLLSSPEKKALVELNDILIRVEDVDHKKAAMRAYMFCLLQAYRRMRAAQPETTSSLSRYTTSFFSGTVFGGCSKEEKLSACDAVEKIIVEKNTLFDVYAALESDELKLHTAAVQDGQLGSYLGVIKKIIEGARSLEDPARRHDWVKTASV